MGAQLVKSKVEREDVLDRIGWQFARRTRLPQRGHFVVVFVKRRRYRIERGGARRARRAEAQARR